MKAGKCLQGLMPWTMPYRIPTGFETHDMFLYSTMLGSIGLCSSVELPAKAADRSPRSSRSGSSHAGCVGKTACLPFGKLG